MPPGYGPVPVEVSAVLAANRATGCVGLGIGLEIGANSTIHLGTVPPTDPFSRCVDRIPGSPVVTGRSLEAIDRGGQVAIGFLEGGPRIVFGGVRSHRDNFDVLVVDWTF